MGQRLCVLPHIPACENSICKGPENPDESQRVKMIIIVKKGGGERRVVVIWHNGLSCR